MPLTSLPLNGREERIMERPKFDGKCLRCGMYFGQYDTEGDYYYVNPYPPIVNPAGNPEIASDEYCPDCNAEVMFYIYRQGSAYRSKRIQVKEEKQ